MANRINFELRAKDKASKVVNKFSDSTMSAMKKLAGPLAIGAVVTGFTALIKKTVEYGDHLSKLNQRLGINIAQFDKLRQIADKSNISIQTLTMAMQRMQRRVAEAAQGTGEAVNALKELGISATELTKLSPDEQIIKIADAMDNVTEAGDKTRLTMKLMDSEGVSLIQMFGGLRTAMENTSSYWNKQSSDDMAEFNTNLTIIKETLGKIAVVITKTLIPAFKRLNQIMNPSKEFELTKALGEASQRRRFATRHFNIAEENKDLDPEAAKVAYQALKDAVEAERKLIQELKPVIAATADKEDRVGSTTGVRSSSEQTPPASSLRSMKGQTRYSAEVLDANNAAEQLRELRKKELEDAKLLKDTWISADKEKKEANERYMTEILEKEKQVAAERMALIEKYSSFFSSKLGTAFGDFVTGAKNAKDAFKDMTRSILNDLARMFAKKAAVGLIGSLFSGFGGGGGYGGGGYGGALSSASSTGSMSLLSSVPMKAGGGPVGGGKPYIVGEQGPELFVPGRSGNIVPNGGGGGGVTVQNNITVQAGAGGSEQDKQSLTKTIVRAIEENTKKVMANEMRVGGLLNRQQRGY